MTAASVPVDPADYPILLRKMDSPSLIAEVNGLRAMLPGGDRHPITRHRQRYHAGVVIINGCGMTRQEIEAQCIRLRRDMQEYHDNHAVATIEARTPYNVRLYDHTDANNYRLVVASLARLPRRLQLQCLAFNGLTDADLA